uniref:C-type lectin domain family 10 member A isoform X2 n=1 Tax=Jaculus jaculus TaxID=51337 RepID=UPI001E1AF623|nr:C-type lectin domain family 10 member A isoform X2 [Jaculus jaculus]
MPITYEDCQNLVTEEKNQETGKVPHCQSILWNIFSKPLLVLFTLGLCLLMLVVVSVIGSQNSQLQKELITLRTTFNNFTSSTKNEVQALASKGESFQETINSLKVEVDDNRKELMSDQSELILRVQKLRKDLTTLTCQLANLKSNASERTCCPLDWIPYESRCYWFSKSGKSWPEADKYCQLENAHLVVVNSIQEQNFIQNHKGSEHTWMGLTDQNGPWRWVDGTDFERGFKNWMPQQPDNWYGHGLGGGEDCAHFLASNGRWNDDVCQRAYHWVCEMDMNKGS